MTTTIYTASSCTSSRKAKAWLSNHDIPYVERNIDRKPLTDQELQTILQKTENGTEEIISTRSTDFRNLGIDLETLSLTALMELIHEKPKLLKRPIIMDEKRLQVGFQEDDIRQFLPRKDRKQQMMELMQAAKSNIPSFEGL
ncbi:MAG TPA: transcriptional regulator Spx [Virgibacillus sp.]|nr:transcriptional regulator Spx [Virgibacillus sp.]